MPRRVFGCQPEEGSYSSFQQRRRHQHQELASLPGCTSSLRDARAIAREKTASAWTPKMEQERTFNNKMVRGAAELYQQGGVLPHEEDVPARR